MEGRKTSNGAHPALHVATGREDCFTLSGRQPQADEAAPAKRQSGGHPDTPRHGSGERAVSLTLRSRSTTPRME
jgi:hypothetical protein